MAVWKRARKALSAPRCFWLAFAGAGLALCVLLASGFGAKPVYDDVDLIASAQARDLWAFALGALPFDANYWRPLPMMALWIAERGGAVGRWALGAGLALLILTALALEFRRAAAQAGWGSPWGAAALGALAPGLLLHPAVAGLWSWQSAVFDLALCAALAWGWVALRATREAPAWTSGAAAFVLTLVCGWCKEAPLPLLALLWAASVAWPRRSGARPLWIGAALGGVALLASRSAALGRVFSPMVEQPGALELAPQALAGYLASVSGWAPSWDSAYGPTPWAVWAGAALGAVALALAWRAKGAPRAVALGAMAQMALLCAALSGGLVSGDAHYAPRHVAFAPLLMALALAPAAAIWAREAARWSALLALAALLGWGLAGARASEFWRSSDQFWSQALEQAPQSPVAAGWRVGELKRAGDFEGARALCERSVAFAAAGPSAPAATGLGYFCAALALERGREDDARRIAGAFEGAWERAPELAYLAGLAALRQHDRDGATEAFVRALTSLERLGPQAKGAERQAIEAKLKSVLRSSAR